MTIERVECWVFRAPIAQPVRTSFGTLSNRPAVFVRVTASDGAFGWGEVFCNFPQVGAEHRARLLQELVAPLAIGQPCSDPGMLRKHLEQRCRIVMLQSGEFGPFFQVIAALDQAMFDLVARRQGLPLWKSISNGSACGQGAPKIRVYASGIGPANVADLAQTQLSKGHTGFKLKVGFGKEKDLINLRELRQVVGEASSLMTDANQAWGVDEAIRELKAIAEFNPAWIEEPIGADEPVSSWSLLKQNTDICLAAGENIRGREDFSLALTSSGIGVIQPDVGKWGGVSGCLEIGKIAQKHGAVLCPHWLGGGIGLAVSMHVRAAMGEEGMVEVDCNPNPLRDDVCAAPRVRDGFVTLGNSPGIGFIPDLDALSPLRVAF